MVDVNSRLARYSMFYLAVVGVCVFIIQPAIVQGFVDALGMTPEQSGYLASAEMWGLAATTVLLAFVSHKVDWHLICRVSLVIAIVGNLGSIGVESFEKLAFVRFLTGLGLGGMISLPFAMVGLTANPDRNFGLLVVWVLVYGAIGVFVTPWMLAAAGLDGVWVFLAVFCGLGLFCIQFLPKAPTSDGEVALLGKRLSSGLVALVLGGVLFFNIAVGMTWAYIFLVGTDAGIEEQSVANVLTLSQFLGILGATLAAIVAQRIGRVFPLAIGILGTGIGTFLFLGDINYFLFSLAIYAFNFAWNVAQPYLLSTISGFGDAAKMLVRAASLQMIGFAAGPFFAALLLGSGSEVYSNVYLVAGVLFVLSWLMILPAQLSKGVEA